MEIHGVLFKVLDRDKEPSKFSRNAYLCNKILFEVITNFETSAFLKE